LATTHTPAPRPVKRSLTPWLLVVLCVAAGAYFVMRWYLPLSENLQRTQAELDATREQNAVARRKMQALESAQAELAALVEQRESEVDTLQQTQKELAAKLEKEIEQGNVAISQGRGQLVVDLIDKILFDSGEAAPNESGMAVLRQVGESFRKVPGKLIQVTGHTDTVPISPKLIERFPSNWELSTQRATNVVRFLQDEVKIPGARLAAVGRSQYDPVANNAKKAGRRRNRRIEVRLMPMPERGMTGIAPRVPARGDQ
jgi:chemotaxis protein MotB